MFSMESGQSLRVTHPPGQVFALL